MGHELQVKKTKCLGRTEQWNYVLCNGVLKQQASQPKEHLKLPSEDDSTEGLLTSSTSYCLSKKLRVLTHKGVIRPSLAVVSIATSHGHDRKTWVPS